MRRREEGFCAAALVLPREETFLSCCHRLKCKPGYRRPRGTVYLRLEVDLISCMAVWSQRIKDIYLAMLLHSGLQAAWYVLLHNMEGGQHTVYSPEPELTLLICPDLPGKALGKCSLIYRHSGDLQKVTRSYWIGARNQQLCWQVVLPPPLPPLTNLFYILCLFLLSASWRFLGSVKFSLWSPIADDLPQIKCPAGQPSRNLTEGEANKWF